VLNLTKGVSPCLYHVFEEILIKNCEITLDKEEDDDDTLTRQFQHSLEYIHVYYKKENVGKFGKTSLKVTARNNPQNDACLGPLFGKEEEIKKSYEDFQCFVDLCVRFLIRSVASAELHIAKGYVHDFTSIFFNKNSYLKDLIPPYISNTPAHSVALPNDAGPVLYGMVAIKELAGKQLQRPQGGQYIVIPMPPLSDIYEAYVTASIKK